jgi:glutamine amidotransferase
MIVIVDYRMGNLGSIANILRKVGAEAVVSSDPKIIAGAASLILPGVGAFDEGMKNIVELGLADVLERRALRDRVPTLGICLGMQLMALRSEEGARPGLGWVPAQVKRFRFPPEEKQLKVPHMGWNSVDAVKPTRLFNGYSGTPRFYFVHSYYVVCDREEDVIATAHYGFEFTAALQHDNLYGVQFHPEKSHLFGMTLLRNFVERVQS